MSSYGLWMTKAAGHDKVAPCHYHAIHPGIVTNNSFKIHQRNIITPETAGLELSCAPRWERKKVQLALTYAAPASCARTAANTPEGWRMTPGTR